MSHLLFSEVVTVLCLPPAGMPHPVGSGAKAFRAQAAFSGDGGWVEEGGFLSTLSELLQKYLS